MEARLTTTYIETPYTPRSDFRRLLNVYARSCEANNVPLEVTCLEGGDHGDLKGIFVENTQKLEHWRQLVHDSDSPIILTDCDMMCVNDPRVAFDDGDWDVAITQRYEKGKRLWFNAGVVFLRPTEAARRFMDIWCKYNQWMIDNRKEHEKWRKYYGGINQAALGKMFDDNLFPDGCTVELLPCNLWNAVDPHWSRADMSKVKLIHIKGALRKALINGSSVKDADHITRQWHKHDAQANGQLCC